MQNSNGLKTLFVSVIFAIILSLSTTTKGWCDDSWQGKVVGISDGDTITVLNGGIGEKIRLYGIDSPEIGQDFGKKAKSFTSGQVFGKMVTVVPIDHDRYARTVAVIYAAPNEESLNESILRAGYAWLYSKYCKAQFCSDWIKMEQAAKESGIGLWSQKNPVAPWVSRTRKSTSNSVPGLDSNSPATETIYHGNTQSHIFHSAGCKHFNCKACTASFSGRDEAITAGYRPCKACNP
jgi:endonuclease YncB( thermonuclease family)